MLNIIQVECPWEILIELHLDAEHFSSLMKQQTALALFREGKSSSGMAARWTGMPRIHFLLMSMQEGAVLLENNADDFTREIALLCLLQYSADHRAGKRWPTAFITRIFWTDSGTDSGY